MKKTCKDSRIDDLVADVIEYAFTEWLVRRGLFTAFKANYDACFPSSRSLRNRMRAHVLFSLCDPNLGPSRLISSAFLYASTPEGANFWRKQSAAWEQFCAKFKTNF